MKFSKCEAVILVLAAVTVAFSAGWFLRGSSNASAFQVETARTLPSQQPQSLPTPKPTEGGTMININTADAAELATLPGIGEKKGETIVAYREEHGPFRVPEQLTDVPGIGESILAEVLDQITVD